MNISNHYWYFKSALTPRFCDDVIEYALQQKEVLARTGDYDKKELSKEDVKNIQKKRKSDFANSGNEAHLSAVGVQSVYGFAAYQDTNGRIPGVCLVECVRQVPGLSFAGQAAS